MTTFPPDVSTGLTGSYPKTDLVCYIYFDFVVFKENKQLGKLATKTTGSKIPSQEKAFWK